MWMLTVGLVFIVQTLSFMNCSCNFICGLSDVIIKTFSQSVSLIVHRPQCRLVTDGRTDTKPQLVPSYNVVQVKILGFLVGSIFCRFPPSVVSLTGWLMIQAYHQQRRQLDNKCYSSHHRSIVDIIIDSGEPANLAEAPDHHIPTICRHSTAWNSPNINYTAPNYTIEWRYMI